jgi:predicted nuclease of restriction endonuclease-like RecB superfamily
MTAAPELAGEALVQRYNLALAQAALLRATRLVVHLDEGDPRGIGSCSGG